MVQLSHLYMTTGKTIPMTIRTFTGKLCVCVCVCVCVCACVSVSVCAGAHARVSGPVHTGGRRARAPERLLMGLGRSCRLASDKQPRRQRPSPTTHVPHRAQEAAGQDSWERCSHSAEATSCPTTCHPLGILGAEKRRANITKRSVTASHRKRGVETTRT